MPQAIVYDRDAALRQGITQAGGALGQALGQRAQQQAQSAQQNQLMQSLGIMPQSAAPGAPSGQVDVNEVSIQEQVEPTRPNPQVKSNLSKLTDQQLLGLKASGMKSLSEVADFEMQRRQGASKEFRADRDFAYKRAGKFLEKVDEQRETYKDKKQALNLMENAIEEGNMTFFSQDNFANFLGKYGEGLRTQKGAQLISAQKEFLISNIGRAGPRPNQWIEQQIQDALTRIGRSKEANLGVVAGLTAESERTNKKIEITDQITEQYERELGYVPGNIAALVDSAMKPFEEQIENKLAYTLRSLFERENSGKLSNLMNKKVPQGTPLTIEMASLFLDKYGDKKKAVKNAEQRGYTIPSPQEYRSYIK